jgi:hypothetical protein
LNSSESDLDLLELAFPIMGANAEKKPIAICGTAFALGTDMYLTAGHVWKNAVTYPLRAIGIRGRGAPDVTLYNVPEAETIDAFDLAILRTSAPAPNKALNWTTQALPLFAEMRAFGYAYGFDVQSGLLNFRGFQGRIVGGTSLNHLNGKPAVFELSFACPRGLSGAPLVSRESESRDHVAGVVLTNHITDVTVSSETETVVETSQEKTVTKVETVNKVEALHLGIAIRSSVVIGIHSTILGGTIGDWLRIHKLLKG